MFHHQAQHMVPHLTWLCNLFQTIMAAGLIFWQKSHIQKLLLTYNQCQPVSKILKLFILIGFVLKTSKNWERHLDWLKVSCGLRMNQAWMEATSLLLTWKSTMRIWISNKLAVWSGNKLFKCQNIIQFIVCPFQESYPQEVCHRNVKVRQRKRQKHLFLSLRSTIYDSLGILKNNFWIVFSCIFHPFNLISYLVGRLNILKSLFYLFSKLSIQQMMLCMKTLHLKSFGLTIITEDIMRSSWIELQPAAMGSMLIVTEGMILLNLVSTTVMESTQSKFKMDTSLQYFHKTIDFTVRNIMAFSMWWLHGLMHSTHVVWREALSHCSGPDRRCMSWLLCWNYPHILVMSFTHWNCCLIIMFMKIHSYWKQFSLHLQKILN